MSTVGYGHGAAMATRTPRSRLAMISQARRLRIETLSFAMTEPGSTRAAELADQGALTPADADCAEEPPSPTSSSDTGAWRSPTTSLLDRCTMLRRGVEGLAATGADRLPFGLACLSWSEYMVGDLTGPPSSSTASTSSTTTPAMPPLVTEGAEMLRALIGLARGGDQRSLVASLGAPLRSPPSRCGPAVVRRAGGQRPARHRRHRRWPPIGRGPGRLRACRSCVPPTRRSARSRLDCGCSATTTPPRSTTCGRCTRSGGPTAASDAPRPRRSGARGRHARRG